VRLPEPVGREAAEEGDRLAQPADRAGGVERPAAGMAAEPAGAVDDEVVERLAADEDDVVGRDGALGCVGRDDGASIRSASVATALSGYVTAA
jgi:hypothetical protein